jgi:hypothetical protein
MLEGDSGYVERDAHRQATEDSIRRECCHVLKSAPTTPIRRKRGPSLSRRVGQVGSVFQRNKPWSPTAPTYGRYWIDVPGCAERKRRTVLLGICSSRSVARRKIREHIETEGINSKESFTTNTAPATTFCAQATKWIASLATRRRKPVKPATIHG